MNNRQIDLRLVANSFTLPIYGGCYPSDKIPQPRKIPIAYVINEDKSGNPGTHWVAIFILSPYHAYYFDSYAGTPNNMVAKYLKQFSRVTRNINRYQAPNTSTCGFYTLYFIYMCSLGYDMTQIELVLSTQINPDFFVVDFVNRNL